MQKSIILLTNLLLICFVKNITTTPPPLTSEYAPLSLLFEQEECDELAKLFEEKKLDTWGPFLPTSTLLNQAIVKSYHDFAKELIERGAPLTNKTSYLMSPLAYAIIRGYTDIVALLIDKGVTLNTKEADLTPFQQAANCGQTEIMKLLAKHNGIADPPSPWGNALHLAAAGGYLETVDYLINELKQNINLQDTQGQTALHHATKMGKVEMVTYLINHHINVALKDGHGNVALALAFNDQLEVEQIKQLVHALLAAGSPTNGQVKKAVDACLKRVSQAPEEQKIVEELKKLVFPEL